MQPNLNPIFARYRFNNEVQGSDSIDAFVKKLKLRAQDCNYAERDNMIRDRIVFGCSSEKCREKLINEGEKLTMDKAIQIVQNYEYCQKQLSSMAPSSHNVDVVSRRPGKGARPKAPSRLNNAKGFQTIASKQQCGNCGTSHEKRKYPAYGKLCHKCHKKITFRSVIARRHLYMK